MRPTGCRTARSFASRACAHLVLVSNERVHTHGLETTWLDLYHAGVSAPELPAESLIVLTTRRPKAPSTRRAAPPTCCQVAACTRRCWSPTRFTPAAPACSSRAAFAHRGLSVRSTPATDSLDLAHWWSHPVAARRVAEEWTKLAVLPLPGRLLVGRCATLPPPAPTCTAAVAAVQRLLVAQAVLGLDFSQPCLSRSESPSR